MRHLFLTFFMMVCCTTMNAQKDVTTFLGIPVDGTKTEMRQKLMAKGFTPDNSTSKECFVGEFNGSEVNIFIVTNNNKVCRIMVCDAKIQDEANIKIRFNKLVSQFENNQRYVHFDKYTLSEEEDISYEMFVHSKSFDALYYQVPNWSKIDTLTVQKQIREQLLEKYSPEQLENPTEEITKETTEAYAKIQAKIATEVTSKKPVWFRINKLNYRNEYYISMFYDNEYNRANGEDL